MTFSINIYKVMSKFFILLILIALIFTGFAFFSKKEVLKNNKEKDLYAEQVYSKCELFENKTIENVEFINELSF